MDNLSLSDIAYYLAVQPCPKVQLEQLSNKTRTPILLLRAIYLIETQFRPMWFRSIEWFGLFLMLPFAFVGVAIPDVSIGPFQTKLSVLCPMEHIKRKGMKSGRISFHALGLQAIVKTILTKDALWFASAHHISVLWEQTCGDVRLRTLTVGHLYNGSKEYGYVVQAMVEYMT